MILMYIMLLHIYKRQVTAITVYFVFLFTIVFILMSQSPFPISLDPEHQQPLALWYILEFTQIVLTPEKNNSFINIFSTNMFLARATEGTSL